MNFEDPLGEGKWTASEAPNEKPAETAIARSNSIWGMKPMTKKLKDFGAEVKNTSPREAVRHVVGAADRAAAGAKHYVQNTTIPGLVDDVTELIGRYPVQALIMGTTLGLRKRANRDERF